MRLLLIGLTVGLLGCDDLAAKRQPRIYYWDRVQCFSGEHIFYDECVDHWSVTDGGRWFLEKAGERDGRGQYITGSCMVIPDACSSKR